jgi:hypothetical protein
MAAVFERQSVLQERTAQELNVNLYRPNLRHTPFNFGRGLNSRPFYLDEAMLDTTHADWIYTALDEITLKNAPPGWTNDEWVLSPVNMRLLPNITVSQKTGFREKDVETTALVVSSANATVITSALRARLQCSTINVPASG